MSGKEMRFQVSPKTFRLDGRITQRIRKWVSNRRTGDWESPRVPNVLRRNRGIFSLRQLAERRCWRPETSETGTPQSARYLGARSPGIPSYSYAQVAAFHDVTMIDLRSAAATSSLSHIIQRRRVTNKNISKITPKHKEFSTSLWDIPGGYSKRLGPKIAQHP